MLYRVIACTVVLATLVFVGKVKYQSYESEQYSTSKKLVDGIAMDVHFSTHSYSLHDDSVWVDYKWLINNELQLDLVLEYSKDNFDVKDNDTVFEIERLRSAINNNQGYIISSRLTHDKSGLDPKYQNLPLIGGAIAGSEPVTGEDRVVYRVSNELIKSEINLLINSTIVE